MSDARYKIIQGHALDVLRKLPDESVHCVVTSPPYFGLRAYGGEPVVWGGEESCRHRWGKIGPLGAAGKGQTAGSGQLCGACGAWRGHLGLEPTPDFFVEHLVAIFREVRRVLRKDGTVWCNLGDGFAGGGHGGGRAQPVGVEKTESNNVQAAWKKTNGRVPVGLKGKDLIGVPWMTAFALRADGWYLRSGIVWAKGVSGQRALRDSVFTHAESVGISLEKAKALVDSLDAYVGNSMPASVADRPAQSHEYVFLLSKSRRYYYDNVAVREPAASNRDSEKGNDAPGLSEPNATRTLRSVWTIPTRPFKDAHFAVMPGTLAETCVRAGTSEAGCCGLCGAPRIRGVNNRMQGRGRERADAAHGRDGRSGDRWCSAIATVGWLASCGCAAPTTRSVVLDPFCGAGTTGVAALKLGRSFVGVELNLGYVKIAERRIRKERGSERARHP